MRINQEFPPSSFLLLMGDEFLPKLDFNGSLMAFTSCFATMQA